MSRKSIDVLNKTWTLIDEKDVVINDVLVEDCENEIGDDINNNTKCIAINETYLSTTINKRHSVNNNNFNSTQIDSYKRHVLRTDHELQLVNYFIRFFNIDQNYEEKCLLDIQKFIKRAIFNYDTIENEIFLEHIHENNALFDENTNILIRLSIDSSFTEAIPQSFDVFLNDLTNKAKLSSETDADFKRAKNETFDTKRSISDLDLKNSALTKLLDVKTSSPLKKNKYFSSNDHDFEVVSAKQEIFSDEDEDEEDADDKHVFNLTYTSLNTNEEQLEQDVINQFAHTNGLRIENIENENLNRTFCKSDKIAAYFESDDVKILNSQPITEPLAKLSDQTIIIEEPGKYQNLPECSYLPANGDRGTSEVLQSTVKQLTPTSNTKIPKFGIPRLTRVSQPQTCLPTIQTSLSSASITSTSTSSSSSLSATNSLTAPILPQLAEVKNHNSVKTSLSIKKSPVKYQQLPQVANKLTCASKENKVNEGLKRPSMIVKSSLPSQQSSEVTTSLDHNTRRATSGFVKPINSELKKNAKAVSMIPSFKSALPITKSSTSTIPVYKVSCAKEA